MLNRLAISVAYPARPAIIDRFGRHPLRKQLLSKLEHLNLDRVTDGLRACIRPPQRHGEGASGTGRCGHSKINFGEPLEAVPAPSRARLHEVALVVTSKPRYLKGVQYVVYVKLRQAETCDRAHQI